jgi:hypothetical protein
MLTEVTQAAAMLTIAGCSPFIQSRKSSSPAAELILRENQRPGTRDWLLNNFRIDPPTKYRCPWIEGYCSRTSVRHGQKLEIYVSTNPASKFSIQFYRLAAMAV